MAKENDAWNWPGLGAFHAIRMGPGVVGRTSTVVLAMILVGGVAIWALKGSAAAVLAIVGATLLLAIGYVATAFWYANKHPQFATLEGAELVRYKEVELAASSPEIIDLSANPSANAAPPLALTSRGGNDA